MPPSRPTYKSSPANTSTASAQGTGHAGFVNLGNTCFLNSVLQAASATTALRDLYHPPAAAASQVRLAPPTSGWESTLGDAPIDRARSPVLCLVDEEKGRVTSTSRRTSDASQPVIVAEAQEGSSSSSSTSTPSAATAPPTPAYEPSSADVPLNTTFRHVLEQTWSLQTAAAAAAAASSNGEGGSGSTTPRRGANAKPASVNPKPLLGALTKKYAEYGEYGQQDGHELLRHLLDAMRMEELDLIKKLQPPPPPNARRRKRPAPLAPAAAAPAPPRTLAASLAAEEAEGEATTPRAAHAADPLLLAQQHQQQQQSANEQTEQQQLKPFVDAVFGGKLLSAVVCEGCKQVSHTYEDFLDISLSLRPEAEGKVKRDRITRMADRWRKATTKPPPRPRSAAETSKAVQRLEEGQLSESEAPARGDEASGIVRPKSAMPRPKPVASSPRASPAPLLNGAGPSADERDRTRVLLTRRDAAPQSGNESEAETAGTGASAPGAAAMNLAADVTVYADAERAFVKPSGGLLRAVSRSSGRSRKSNADPASRDGSPAPPEPNDGSTSDADGASPRKKQQTRQSAYTSKLFADLPGKAETSGSAGFLWGRWGAPAANGASITSVVEAATAAARVRQASQGASTSAAAAPGDALAAQAGTGLVKALASFTSVEVLDGDNSYACKRCWRLANPATPAERARQMRRRARRGQNHDDSEKSSDDEDSDGAAADEFDEALQDITTAATSLEIASAASSKPASLDDQSSRNQSRSPSVAPIVTHEHISTEATLTPRSGTLLASAAAAAAASQANGTGSSSAGSSSEELRSIMRPIPIIQTTSPLTPIAPALPSASPRWPGADGTLQAPRAVAAGPLRRLGASGSDYSTSDDDTEATTTTTGDETDFSATSASEAEPRSAAPSRAPSTHFAERDAPLPTRRRSTQSVPQRALKRYLIASTPRVLVIHFKRFQHVNRTYGFSSFASGSRKIDDFVSFPEFLDVKPWLAPPREEYDRFGKLKRSSDARALRAAEDEARTMGTKEEGLLARPQKKSARWHWPGKTNKAPESTATMPGPRTQYRLYAVVVHQGTMTSGHYTAFILAPKPGAKPATAPLSTGSTTSLNSAGSAKEAASSSPEAQGGGTEPASSKMERGPSASSTTSAAASTTSSRASSSTPNAAAAAAPPVAEEERQWLYTSDTTVRTATIEEVLRAKAYMTFYEQL